jgi:hypothetical protein
MIFILDIAKIVKLIADVIAISFHLVLSLFLYYTLSLLSTTILGKIAPNVRLYMTFRPAHKALRGNAAGRNVGEGAVGA